MVDLEFLSQVELCKGLEVRELAAVQKCCSQEVHQAGEQIFKEGQKAQDLAIVVEGQVELRFELPGRTSETAMTISLLDPGDCFGWSAFVEPRCYRLSSYAGPGGCVVLSLNSEDLSQLFTDHPHVGYIFMRNLAGMVGARFHGLQDALAKQMGFDLIDCW